MKLLIPPSAPDHLPGSAGRARRGQGLMEFALILPLLLLFLLGIIETGHLLVIFSSVSSAAKQSSRYGSVGGDSGLGIPYYLDCAGMRRSAQSTSFLQPLADTDISIRYDHGLITQSIGLCVTGAVSPTLTQSIRDGDRVVISITTTYRPLLPIVPLPTIPMTFVAAHSIFTTILGPTPTPRPNPDLAITKKVVPSHILAGESPLVTYTVQISNTGPVVANNIVVTDTLPAGMNLISVTISTRNPPLLPVDWSCPTHPDTSGLSWNYTFTCTLPYLGVGQTSSVITITATAPLTPGIVSNVAQVKYGLTDPVASNNSSTASTFVSSWVDMQANKTTDVASVAAGGQITYSITVQNNNWVDTGMQTVTDTLPTSPAGTSLVSATGTGWSCIPSGAAVTTNVVCTNPTTLTVGSTAPTITVVLQLGSPDCTTCTFITNTVNVSSTIGDPFPLNNTATISTAIIFQADMALFKTGPSGVDANSTFNYTLHATNNNGPAVAARVRITDTVPLSATVTGAAGTNWACSIVSNEVRCLYSPLLAQNASTTNIVITATAPNANVTLVNTATVGADDIDPNSANNTATVSTNVTTCLPGIVDPSHSQISSSPGSTWADNFSTSTILVTLRDACDVVIVSPPNNPQLVTLTSSRGGSDTVTLASGYANPTSNGQVAFTVKSGVVGTSTYTATVKNTVTNVVVNLTNSAQVSFNSYTCVSLAVQTVPNGSQTFLQFNATNNSGYPRRLIALNLSWPDGSGRKFSSVALGGTTLWTAPNGTNSSPILIGSGGQSWDATGTSAVRTLANGTNQMLQLNFSKSVLSSGAYSLTTTWDDGTGAQTCTVTGSYP